jgi:hypothetical protein
MNLKWRWCRNMKNALNQLLVFLQPYIQMEVQACINASIPVAQKLHADVEAIISAWINDQVSKLGHSKSSIQHPKFDEMLKHDNVENK